MKLSICAEVVAIPTEKGYCFDYKIAKIRNQKHSNITTLFSNYKKMKGNSTPH